MFLNVLFKALRADPSAKRVMVYTLPVVCDLVWHVFYFHQAFIKRLLQVCFYQRADFSCAVLYLISEVHLVVLNSTSVLLMILFILGGAYQTNFAGQNVDAN